MTVTSPPTVEQLAQALELLGRPVTVSPNAPTAPAALQLTRVLVALAEQHAIAAERAAAEADTDPADVEVSAYQDTYDKATTGGALELLVLAYWRAQRLTAGVKALRAQLTRTETETERTGKPSALAVVWDLIGPAAAAVEGLLGMEAHLTVTDDSKAMVAQLDAATALLVHLGGKAGRLRAHIGLDFNPPEGKAVDPNSVSVVAGPTGGTRNTGGGPRTARCS